MPDRIAQMQWRGKLESKSNYFFQPTSRHHKRTRKLQDQNKGAMASLAKKYRILLATNFTRIQISVCLFNVKVASILPQFETLLDWMEIQRVSMSTSGGRSTNKKMERSVKENRAHFVPKRWHWMVLPPASSDIRWSRILLDLWCLFVCQNSVFLVRQLSRL